MISKKDGAPFVGVDEGIRYMGILGYLGLGFSKNGASSLGSPK